MRRKSTFLAAAALLVAATYGLAQGRKDSALPPYRAVVTTRLTTGMGKARDKFLEMPELTEAINNFAADGYEVQTVVIWKDDRLILIGKKK